MDAKLIYVKIKQIKTDTGFFQELPEEDYRRLKESILQIGLIYPVVLCKSKDGDTYEIVDGRNRIKVLQEIGMEEVPALVYEVTCNVDKIIQFDSELCRRHLSEEEKKTRWELDRAKYFQQIKNHVRKDIIQTLKMEDVEIVKKHLESLTLLELVRLRESLTTTSGFAKFLNTIAGKIAASVARTESAKNGAEYEELIKTARTELQKEIENLRLTLEEKEAELVELTEKLKAEVEEKKRLEKEYKEFINKQKEIIRKAVEEKEKEYQEKVNKLQQEINRLRLSTIQNPEELEEVKKLLQDLREKAEKEKKDLIIQYEQKEAEWRKELAKYQEDLLRKKEELEQTKEEIKKLREKLNFLSSYKEQLEFRLNEYKSKFEELSNEKSIVERLEVIRNDLKNVLNSILTLGITFITYEGKTRTIIEDIKAIIKEIEDSAFASQVVEKQAL